MSDSQTMEAFNAFQYVEPGRGQGLDGEVLDLIIKLSTLESQAYSDAEVLSYMLDTLRHWEKVNK